jgi:hypothetical protein
MGSMAALEHLNAHSSLIKPISQLALEKLKNQKNPYFWLSQQKMGSMAGTFTTPEFNSSYTITDSNLVRIGDKKFLENNHVPPPSIQFSLRKII